MSADHHSIKAKEALLNAHDHASAGRHEEARRALDEARAHHNMQIRYLKSRGEELEAQGEAKGYAEAEGAVTAKVMQGRVQEEHRAPSPPAATVRPKPPADAERKWSPVSRGSAKKSESMAKDDLMQSPKPPKAMDAGAMPQPKVSLHPSWTPSRSKGTVINFHHPEHGTVSVVHNERSDGSKTYDVRHNGGMAGLKGQKGSFATPHEAFQHTKSYLNSITSGKTAGNRQHNRPSPAAMMAAPLSPITKPKF